MSIEIKRYADLKARGAVRIMRWGAGYAMEIKKYDPITGEAMAPDTATVDRDALMQQAAEYTALAAAINELLADIEALS